MSVLLFVIVIEGGRVLYNINETGGSDPEDKSDYETCVADETVTLESREAPGIDLGGCRARKNYVIGE